MSENYASQDSTVLQVDQLTLEFGGLRALEHLSFQVQSQEILALIGPNGAGKTSRLRIAAAMEHPSSGIAYVRGERLGRVLAGRDK